MNQPRTPWLWVPSLYFSQGVPFVIVMSVSVVMYKRLGISNTDLTLYTSGLYLPWVLKPLWSPFVDVTGTKRRWIVTMQFLVAGGLGLVAFSVPGSHFILWTLCVFWIMALASATHDIAADGFYMLALTKHKQTLFVGVRSVFYRVAMIFGTGLLVMLAGVLEKKSGNIPFAWSITLYVVAAVFLGFACWHTLMLPRPARDGPVLVGPTRAGEFFATWRVFFQKPGVIMALAFILFYRFDEAQLSKVISPFMLDDRTAGGLGLTTTQVGLAYGTCGVIALLGGGVLGGFLASKFGLKRMLPIMVAAMYVPKFAFWLLACTQPVNFLVISSAVAVEQFGYGFGFAAFMLYLLYFADGPHRTAHYAICTGFMALGMMIPGLWSGWLVDHIGYRHFFVWVICSTLPGLTLALRLKIDPQFGRKTPVPLDAIEPE